ncbi:MULTISPECIES: DUF5694 domain-containing protein [unclassified Massilia]|uniref:DUF5694 domain-containing protein n=1 Tax=unclassified Massilia TaxID=2609279 RepID=UPI00068CC2DC|nr:MULTISPECIES: DUF5694 domain-containing protein [unclassified Massilia]ALK98691.2 hypothetical protein AM586_23320 [Massilia sp. WG5]
MGTWTKWTWGSIAALPLVVQAQAPARIDLTTLDRDMAGPRAQVLVLGTVHLREMPKSFKPAALDPVLDRLAAFKPEIVTIEDEPGEDCDLALRHPAKYGADYCDAPDAARKATGLEIPAALAEIHKTLKTWPAQPAPAQRRHLAALFLAAHEPASGYVQWLRLPEAERRAGDGLDAALVEQLGKLGTRNNESIQLAARLAARLGLERVYPVDNHTGDNIDVPDVKAYARALEAAWATGRAELDALQKREEPLKQASDLLPLYRAVNDPNTLRVLAEVNVVPSLRAQSPEGYPRMFVGGWEVRNLRMVANIRETFRERPAARVLSIVGASHKPWFDAWLGQLQGVDIVDAEAVLK